MKHLLNGVAIAAALAIAAPVWAQAPMTPSSSSPPKPAAAAPAAPAAAPAAPAAKQAHKRPMRHAAKRGRMARGESTTQQLNRQELARVQGAPMAPPPARSTTPAMIGSP